MKTDTEQRILAYIKEKGQVSAKDIVAFLGFTPQAVFRHLKELVLTGEIIKIGAAPKVKYSAYINMNSNSKLITNATNWALLGDERFAAPEQLCQTRDVFQARTDRLIKTLKLIVQSENLVFLLSAIAGEIGNNSFDHNIGQWSGIPGVFFVADEKERIIIIADRGQGVLATLKRVRPNIVDDAEALKIAFTEVISGRAPEQRGNGLKFVKKVIMENNIRLLFYSGNSLVSINSTGMIVKHSAMVIPGTLSIINF